MKRLVCGCYILFITPLLTCCEKDQTTLGNPKTMDHTDLDDRFVMATFDQTSEDVRDKGWDNVREEQRHLSNVIAFYGKIENGGFGGFYFDSEYLSDMLNEFSGSLKAVGAFRAEGLLRASTLKFEGGVVPPGMDARISVAQTYPDDFDPFEELDGRFYVEAEPYISLLADYIRAQPTAFK